MNNSEIISNFDEQFWKLWVTFEAQETETHIRLQMILLP